MVEETKVPGENHRPAASHWQTLSHNVVSSTPHLSGIQTHNVSYRIVKALTELPFLYEVLLHFFKMYFGQGFYTPIKLQKIAFDS